MKSMNLKLAVAAVLLGATAMAFGAPGGGKGPPDGKGNKPDTEAGFNLSVPAIIVGTGAGFAINCSDSWAALDRVTGEPTAYPAECQDPSTVPGDDEPYCVDAGDYFVQRVHTWQAPCLTAGSASVVAEWGDNLSGDAALKVGSPIRVEIVLFDSTTGSTGQEGYKVIKLEPNELDRNSDYGHLAGEGGVDIPLAVDGTIFRAIVHDANASLTIELVDADGYVVDTVYDGEAGAEINATGKIVYGHNLRVGLAGTYRLTYSLPNVMITDVDIGTYSNNDGIALAILEIEVTGGGGGGGGKKPPKTK